MSQDAAHAKELPRRDRRSGKSFRFGEYVLTTRPAMLLRGEEVLELAPQPARLLELLVSRAGDVVSREEIRGTLWGDKVHIEYEGAINFNIRQIRSVLEDKPSDPRFIETVPRQGYRFLGSVTEEPGPRQKRWRMPQLQLLVILAVPFLGLASFLYLKASLASPAADEKVSVEDFSSASDAGSTEVQAALLPPSAADDYQVARQLLERGLPGDWEKAFEALHRTLEAEPDFGPAYSALSHMTMSAGDLEKAQELAQRALALDPKLTEARLVLAWFVLSTSFDLEEAKRLVQEVLRDEPESSLALEMWVQLQVTEGKTEEAVETARKLYQLKPVSRAGRWALAWALFQDRQYEASIEYAKASRELFPQRPMTPYDLWIHSLVRLGRSEEAVEVGNQYFLMHNWESPPLETIEDWWRFWLEKGGEPGENARGRERLAQATFYLGVGEHERAMSLLEEACRSGSYPDLFHLRADPRLDPLRLHPGFQKLLACGGEATTNPLSIGGVHEVPSRDGLRIFEGSPRRTSGGLQGHARDGPPHRSGSYREHGIRHADLSTGR